MRVRVNLKIILVLNFNSINNFTHVFLSNINNKIIGYKKTILKSILFLGKNAK